MESWSNFEQRQKKTRDDTSSSDQRKNDTKNIGIDALYVSSSSSNIAPSSATLLRHAGLSAPSTNSSKNGTTANGGDDQEFRLRFHFMRPHPSLAFSCEEGTHQAKDVDDAKANHTRQTKTHSNPAFEASKLMDAYRTSQINKQLDSTKEDGDNNNNTSDDNNTKTISLNIPLELPKLRINLASLVEPPLMSSWLPGDDDSEE